jgi:hypothetical protein
MLMDSPQKLENTCREYKQACNLEGKTNNKNVGSKIKLPDLATLLTGTRAGSTVPIVAQNTWINSSGIDAVLYSV